MRRYLLRALVALFAFAAGVVAATLLGGALGLNSSPEQRGVVEFSSKPRACASKVRLEAAPVPAEPAAPLPPVVVPVEPVAPLPVGPGQKMVYSVRLPDGTVRVIEMKTEKQAR